MTGTATRRAFIMGVCAGSFSSAIVQAKADNSASHVVSVADYGVFPGSADVTAGVRAAIARLPKQGGATLLFPPGTYHFAGNTDVALPINGIEKLTVEGQGATLIFRDKTFPALISDCDGLALRGLRIDWSRPPFSQGEVTTVSPHFRVLEVRVDQEFPVDGSEPIQAITTHDRATGLPAMRGIDAYNLVEKVTLIGPQLLRLDLKRPVSFHPGDVAVLRHQVYGTNVFRVTRCKDVYVEDVRVYAAPGMALLAEESTNVTIRQFVVKPTPGSSRLMSTCADGLHLASCRGVVDIENCHFSNLGDDCINVHGEYLTVVERLDARTLLVDRPEHRSFQNFDLMPVHDHAEFLTARSLRSLGEREVAEATPGRYERLRFTDDLPSDLKAGDLLCDTEEIAQLRISNCQFPGNRARGILAHRNAVIEHCSFANQFEEAVLMLSDASGMEGPTVSNVIIAHNDFRDTGRAQLPHGAIRVGALSTGANGALDAPPGVVNTSINIVGNAIVNSGASAIEIGETRDIKIEANRIERHGGAAILLRDARNVTISGNTCEPPSPLVLQDTPKQEVTLHDNKGLLAQ